MATEELYEDDPLDCLDDCEWPMLSDCPDWCVRHSQNGNRGKIAAKKSKVMRMLLKGKSETLIMAVTGACLTSVRRWEKELAEFMEDNE